MTITSRFLNQNIFRILVKPLDITSSPCCLRPRSFPACFHEFGDSSRTSAVTLSYVSSGSKVISPKTQGHRLKGDIRDPLAKFHHLTDEELVSWAARGFTWKYIFFSKGLSRAFSIQLKQTARPGGKKNYS